ncbi:hypothetical protein PAXINDRAFT_18863 [Paxillus involutus ATCC 200175]|uniref:Uncharacterized protein n=1 Tax=Paxillus involutus ATCC 200175 TaxID=664439 RepID=A0A0C9TJ56_PAXIN|nr:hypothetical protein PAXINDRAFT_18863 [Paxillus involutus ATCC 200175]
MPLSDRGTTDQLLYASKGPRQCPIQAWYEALIYCQRAPGSHVFVVESIEHHKQPWNKLHDEFLLLRVAPVDTDGGARTRIIIIGRTIQRPFDCVLTYPRPGLLSELGILGPAIEWVMVLPRGNHDVTLQQPLSSISWSRRDGFAPRLVDLIRIFRHVSIVQPNFNVFTTQCCWFARAAYLVTRAVYYSGHISEREWDKHWNLSPALRFGTLSRTTLMTSHSTCEALETLIAYHAFVLDRD